MKVTKAFSSCLDRQLAEKVDIANFTGPVMMNRRTEMGGVRIERQQYRRWGGNRSNPTFRGPHTLPQLCSQQSQGGEVNTRQEEPGGFEEGCRAAVVLETDSYSKVLANE